VTTSTPHADDPIHERLRALVVDDDAELRNGLVRILQRAGFEVTTAADGVDGLERLSADDFDAALVDVAMPRMTGPELLTRAKRAGLTTEIVIMTAIADFEIAINAVHEGAFEFLTKPFVSNDAVVIAVRNASQRRQLTRRNHDLAQELAAKERSPQTIDLAPLLELPYAEAKSRALSLFNEHYLGELMQRTGSNVSEAARRSGLDRSNFRRLVRSVNGREGGR